MNLEPEEEAALIERVKEGKTEDFEPLVDCYQNRLFHFVLRQMGSFEEALDITQEVFLKAFHKLEMFRGDSRFGTWLTRIAINECRSRFRQKKSRPQLVSLEHISQDPLAHGAAPESQMGKEEEKKQLHQALGELDPTYSQPLILFHLQGHSHQEIANLLGIPLGTVKTRLHRGHKHLASQLRKNQTLADK